MHRSAGLVLHFFALAAFSTASAQESAFELNDKEYPFLWQQAEYVMGGGASHYMFLVLAEQDVLKR